MNKPTPQHKDFHSGGPSVLQYLSNTLTASETRKIEECLSDDQMLVDAIEGLRQMDVNEVAKIDLRLKKYIKHTVIKRGRNTKLLGFPSWLFITLVILLFLISIGYFVISKLLG